MTEKRTTMLLEDGLKVGMVNLTTWADALDKIRDGQLPDTDRHTLTDWQSAGIATPDGLAPDWALAIHVAQEATSGMEIVATYRNVAFNTTILVLEPHVVTITSRTAIENTNAGPQATSTDPILEVALASDLDPWRLLQRVLPPLDAVRAQPRLPRAEELEPLTLDVSDIPDQALADQTPIAPQLQQLPNLPASIRDALDPVASVFAYGIGQVAGQLHTSNDAWSIGEQDLYHLVPGQPGLTKVPPGQLGAQLLLQLAKASSANQ